MYTNRACSFHLTAAPSDSLLAKAVSCPVSVLKADSVQGGGATNRVRREIKYSVANNGPFQ